MTRLETQILVKAGHTQADIARRLHLSERSVRTIGQEPAVFPEAFVAPPPGRGRPSKVDPFRNRVTAVLAGEPELPSLEIVRRLQLAGYDGQKSALYALIASLRQPDAAAGALRGRGGQVGSMTSATSTFVSGMAG